MRRRAQGVVLMMVVGGLAACGPLKGMKVPLPTLGTVDCLAVSDDLETLIEAGTDTPRLGSGTLMFLMRPHAASVAQPRTTAASAV